MVPSVEVRAGAEGRQGQSGLKTGGAGGTLRQGRRPGRVVGWFASGQLSVESPQEPVKYGVLTAGKEENKGCVITILMKLQLTGHIY